MTLATVGVTTMLATGGGLDPPPPPQAARTNAKALAVRMLEKCRTG